MTRTEPRIIRRRPRLAQPTVELNPHTVHLLSGPALYDLVIDCGSDKPVTVIKLPADLAHILHTRLERKLQTL